LAGSVRSGLPAIAEAISGRMDIQADGRVRRHRPLPRVGRGGVLIGRATLYGVAVGGAAVPGASSISSSTSSM